MADEALICVECGLPVELDELERVRRTRIEQRARDVGLVGYRLPDNLHRGKCLARHEQRAARAAIEASNVPSFHGGAR